MQTTSGGLTLLPIPSLDELTERQVRGLACVWDGVPLVNGIAVDLGVRTTSRAGEPVSWYPRACRPCTTKAALAALHEHAPGCAECRASPGGCDTGRALQRLISGSRR